MSSEPPWFAYPIIFFIYFIFETIYRSMHGRLFITHIVEELLGTVREIKEEIESDIDGAKLCAWAITFIIFTAFLILIYLTVPPMIYSRSIYDIITTVILLIFFIPFIFFIRWLNTFFMSWITTKKTET